MLGKGGRQASDKVSVGGGGGWGPNALHSRSRTLKNLKGSAVPPRGTKKELSLKSDPQKKSHDALRVHGKERQQRLKHPTTLLSTTLAEKKEVSGGEAWNVRENPGGNTREGEEGEASRG